MGVFSKMTSANVDNIANPNVTIGNKKFLAAAINTTAALIDEGANANDAAYVAINRLLDGFQYVLSNASSAALNVSPEYANSVTESIKYFKVFLED
jgi:hypothetical protein